MSSLPSIGVLVSGSGSNLQAIIDAVEAGCIPCKIGVVISNKADAYGLVRARSHGIPTEFVDHRSFDSREAFDAHLVKILRSYDIRLVCLAGFMRLLTPTFLGAFPMRVLNIHPALLPSFPGTHGPRDALNYGVRFSGCTVHFIDEGIDTGPIVAQAVVPVYEDDTEESLAARILKEEHRVYPMAIRLFLEEKLTISEKKVFTGNAGRISGFSCRNPDT
ncbi:MAG: phosphoribosylglycinamide formyltransferase [Syntrophorhabdaceae bacterium]|nr:phosphoribosylglycinamide formyltransferase [Syntrophorhabdaceae bacterium]